MRNFPVLTSSARRALLQFTRDLRLQHGFSTARGVFNVQTSSPQPEASATTESREPEKQDPGSIHYLLKNNVINTPVHSALVSLGYQNLTPVQEKSIEPVLTTDADFIMKAKTGTGKTLAFGIPLVETVLKAKHFQGVVGIVIAPTRDLAFQIRDELNKIVKYKEVTKHTKNMLRIQTIVGGEKRYDQVRAFRPHKNQIPSIVVATPGRLMDVIQEPEVADAFVDLECLVLDEADRLLGEGFKEDLIDITDKLKEIRERGTAPKESQLKTMLYSATLDKVVLEFSKKILRPGFKYIDTVDKNAPETHEKINQSLILTDDIFESYVSAMLFVERESALDKNFKAIIFLPTIKAVSYFYELLSNRLRHKRIRLPSYQLHGQLRQQVRDRSVKDFRRAFSGILVASDVGARGMDFPNVTNVIQIGLPMDATNYVHRVGRTARGGNTGNAVVILTQSESRFLRVLKTRGLNISSQFEYEKSDEDEADIAQLSQQVRHKFTLDLVVESLAGFTKGVSGTYRLDMFGVLEELKNAYAKFVQDETRRPHVTHSFASRVLGLGRRDANEIFDLEGTHVLKDVESSGNRDSSDRGFSRNRRESNDDGFYTNRRDSNDRYTNNRTSRDGYSRRDNSRGSRSNNRSEKRWSNDRNDSRRKTNNSSF